MSEGGGSDQREVGVRPTVVAAAEAMTFESGVTLESAPMYSLSWSFACATVWSSSDT